MSDAGLLCWELLVTWRSIANNAYPMCKLMRIGDFG